MKNSKKLLAFVIAFAMVMSVMVVPVSAADVPAAPQNLMVSDSYDWSFENAEGTHYSKISKATASVVTPEESDTLQPTDGDSYLLLTYDTTQTGGGHIQLQAVGKTFLEQGTYVVSMDAALAPGSAGDGTAKINVGGQSSDSSTISVTTGEGCNSNVALNSNSFTTISGLFTVGAGTGIAGNNGMFITISVPQGNNLYIDNLCVKEYLPPMTATVAGVEEGVEVDPRNALPLTYTFSNAPYEFTAANVEVTPPGADVTVGAVTRDDTNSYTATVTLSNLATNANYTVALANVQDMHAKAAKSTISFATNGPTAFENLLAADYNAGFETDSTKDFGYYENSTTAKRDLVTPTAEDGLLVPVEGDSYLKFTDRDSYNDRIQFDGVGADLRSVQLEAGKEYEVSYYAATVNAGETATAAVKVDSKNATTGNTIIVEGTDNNVQGEDVTITSDKFTKVSAIVKIIENPAENKKSNLGVKIYSYIEATKSFYIDDFCVKEYDPMTATVAGITDGETLDATSATLRYTFTNEPYVFTAANVEVTPDAGVSVGTVTGDDKAGYTATVTLSNLRKGVEYNVALTGVQDMYAQVAKAEVSFTTTSFYLQSANLASGATLDASTGNIDTVDGITTVDKTQAGSARWLVPYVLGNRYILTASVKSNDETPNKNASVEVRAGDYASSRHYYKPENAYTAPSVYLGDNEWHELYNVAVINNPVACDCKDGICTKNSSTAGAYAHAYVNGLCSSFSVKDMAVRELKALDVDGTCYATVVRNGDTARLYLEAPGKTKIYFAAVSMVSGKAADIQFVAADLTEGFPVAALDLAIGDSYKIMVWDGNFAPLCNAFLGSDL